MKPSYARISRSCDRLLTLVLALMPMLASAQPGALLIDRVAAVVGREMVLESDLMARVEQARSNNITIDKKFVCGELEDLLYEGLLIEQARLDSVTVDEAQVTAEIDRRIRYFSAQIGGDKKLEEFYGKSIAEIKSEFRDQVHDQLLVQNMQQKVTTDIRITPRDVQRFYQRIPADSIPFINSEVEWAQILMVPEPTTDEERRVRRKIEEYREAIQNGTKDFCTVAILYSEDPGSAKDCGELGLVPTGTMVPEFDAVALSLKEGEISQVFRTTYGYHFMQLIERRGEQYNARHVLMRPQVGSSDLQMARTRLDTLLISIREGRIPFGTAAAEYSDDEESRSMNGVMIEPNSNSTRWDIGALEQQTFFVLDKMQPGDISDPQLIVMPDGTKAYRSVKLMVRTDPHRANLKDDYRLIQQAAEGKLRSEAVDKWVQDHLEGTYVRLAEDHADCPFQHTWYRVAASE